MPEPDIASLLKRASIMSNDHAMWATNPDGVKSYIEGAAALRDLARDWLVYKAAKELAEDFEQWYSGRIERTNEALLDAYRAAKAAAESTPWLR